jgi:hypothetical protein
MKTLDKELVKAVLFGNKKPEMNPDAHTKTTTIQTEVVMNIKNHQYE